MRCSNAAISQAGISRVDGENITFSVPREQIRSITLAHDTGAGHPFCQYLLGFMLTSFGVLGLFVVFFASTGKSSLTRQEEGEFVLPLIPILLWIITGAGLWLLSGIFRARYHLLIATDKETWRIFFDKEIEIGEIRQFLRKAGLNFGYTIDMSILENMPADRQPH